MRSKDHGQQAAKDGAIVDCCTKMEECYGAMGKAAGKPDGDMYAKIAANWSALKNVHENSQAYHTGAAKAAEDELGKRLVPDRISSVASIDTPTFGIRAIPRAGAPSVDVDKTVINQMIPSVSPLDQRAGRRGLK